MKELTYQAVARLQPRAAAISGVHFDRIMALLCAWLIAGAYLDGWAHNHIADLETFFTPWHGILYSGFASAAGVLVSVVLANRVRGYSWREAVPAGYGYALLGTGLFALAGVGDMIWHVMLGIESNIEALLSPTHIVLAFSAGLLVSGPFCAAWVRAGRGAATSWRTWFPVVLSLVLLEAVVTIFSDYINPFAHTWAANQYIAARFSTLWVLEQSIGVGGVLLQSALLVALLLLLIRRWGAAVPVGTFTLVVGATIAGAMIIHDIDMSTGPWAMVAVGLIAGVATDALWALLRPAARPAALRLFAAVVPLMLYGLYFLAILALGGGIWWTAHVWLGAIVLAGITGLLVSLLVFPPALPAASPLED